MNRPQFDADERSAPAIGERAVNGRELAGKRLPFLDRCGEEPDESVLVSFFSIGMAVLAERDKDAPAGILFV